MWYIYPHRHAACLNNEICHTQMQRLKVIMAYFQKDPNGTCFNICIMTPFSDILFKKMKCLSAQVGCTGQLNNRGLWAALQNCRRGTTVLQGEINSGGKGREKIKRGWSEEMKADKNVKLNKTRNYWSKSQIRKNVSQSSVTYKSQPRNRM